jgi:hypothetical protein
MIADPIKRFELWFLRPLWGMTIVTILAAAINLRWWWVVGGVFSVMYLGVIGAQLHPSRSAMELAHGPQASAAAIAESNAMARAEKAALVMRACYRVAHLLMAWSAACFIIVLGWRWYIAIPAACFAWSVIAAVLILAFAERSRN